MNWSRLKFKFGLAGAALVLPLVLVTHFFVSGINDLIDLSQKELQGQHLLMPTHKLKLRKMRRDEPNHPVVLRNLAPIISRRL